MAHITGNGVNVEYKNVKTADVLVVGSGPIGATYTRKLVDAGLRVLMVDIGEQSTRKIGDHKKNSVAVQRDISLFTDAVKGELSKLSIPVDFTPKYVEPVSWSQGTNAFIHNGQNPNQKAYENLPAAAATRVVGGMGSHWTCCTPRQLPGIERSDIYSEKEWDRLYDEAEALFHTNHTAFDKSIRHQLVKHVLQDAYGGKREFVSMPLACQRNQPNQEYVEWTATATILGDLADPRYNGDRFQLLSQHRCVKLQMDEVTQQVSGAILTNLLTDETVLVKAKKYVICAGAILTPGILFNSGFSAEAGYEALGHYLTEQTMCFCQIVLKRKLVDSVIKDPYGLGWTALVEKHKRNYPKDPLPFPFKDPDPQVYTPLSKEHPWHTQIHRDAFGYGAVPAEIDQRLVVDLRFFGYIKPSYDNWVEFSREIKDGFGMPQPTFHYKIDADDADRTHAMMKDMVEVASNLGGFLPGAEPQYLVPGSALHIGGTTRIGEKDDGESVVDRHSKVWRQNDLYLGGVNVIPTQNACNPTLTAACYAIIGAENIIEKLKDVAHTKK